MAHKGNPYPVLFRRDWNLNVQRNNDGYANRYLCTLNFELVRGFGTLSSRFIYDCGPATFFPPNEMRWDSGVVNPAGFFSFRLVLRSFLGTHGYNKRIDLIESTAGTIASWNRQLDGLAITNFEPTPDDRCLFFSPTFFDNSPPPHTAICPAKVWADGPPH